LSIEFICSVDFRPCAKMGVPKRRAAGNARRRKREGNSD